MFGISSHVAAIVWKEMQKDNNVVRENISLKDFLTVHKVFILDTRKYFSLMYSKIIFSYSSSTVARIFSPMKYRLRILCTDYRNPLSIIILDVCTLFNLAVLTVLKAE